MRYVKKNLSPMSNDWALATKIQIEFFCSFSVRQVTTANKNWEVLIGKKR